MGALLNLFRRSSQTQTDNQSRTGGKGSAHGSLGGWAGNLTVAQRSIIARTWPKIYIDIPGNGVNVMIRLMMMQSDVKMLFNFRNKTDDDMLLDRSFFTHSCRFIQAVMAVIDNIDVLEETVMPLFLRIGRKHVTVPDFETKYFKMLPDAYCFVWESQMPERFTEPMEKAWRMIFDFIVNQMIDGFEIESALRQRVRSLRKIAIKSNDLMPSPSVMTTIDNESQENDTQSISGSILAQPIIESTAPKTAKFPQTVPEIHVEDQPEISEPPSSVDEESHQQKESQLSPAHSKVTVANENAEKV